MTRTKNVEPESRLSNVKTPIYYSVDISYIIVNDFTSGIHGH